MDPQAFTRLSIESLGLRIPTTGSKARQGTVHASFSRCSCEIRLRGFPVQTASVPLISPLETNIPDHHSNNSTTIFYLEDSDVNALQAPGCFEATRAHLQIVVYIMGSPGSSHCGVTSKKQQIGTCRVDVGPECSEGKPLLLHNGWIGIGKNKKRRQQATGKPGPELHLRVKVEPDPRYVFQFEDETALSPQIVQIQGNIKQPIFSCKFSRDRRTSQLDPNSDCLDRDTETRRKRKGWKVMIHDLSGSAVASAFMATPFVPSTGCDRVDRSNPGAWLVVRPDPLGTVESWHPWGRLEAWRETRDTVCLRLYLLPECQEAGVLVSEIMMNTHKGGEFFVDLDRKMPAPSSQGDFDGGFVMNCRVQGEGKRSRPLVQLAMRHVTCVEDAAIFLALAAAVDLSMEACRPFRRKAKKTIHHSSLSS